MSHVVCTHCQGTGAIELTGVYAETLRLVIGNPGLNGAALAKLAGCKATAMNNRLSALDLRAALSTNEVNRLDADEADKNVCHSHDFCDANQVMIDVLGEEFENTDKQNALISQAWEIAKNAEFSPVMIGNDERGRG